MSEDLGDKDEHKANDQHSLVSIPSFGVVSHIPESELSFEDIDEGDNDYCVKLDSLGPIVLNSDGTMGRIGNWSNMTETEQAQAIRLISARNKKRKDALVRLKAAETSTSDFDLGGVHTKVPFS